MSQIRLKYNIRALTGMSQTVEFEQSHERHLQIQLIKAQKTIEDLQNKLRKCATVSCDTAGAMIMPSEFRNKLEQLMTTLLPVTFTNLLDQPRILTQLFKDIYMQIYSSIERRISCIITKVCSILHLDSQQSVRSTLIPLMQAQWRNIFRLPSITDLIETHQNSDKLYDSDSINQFITALHELCCFMRLQQKPLNFDFTDNLISYAKKDQILIDGFAKEGQLIIPLLNGVKRANEIYPNVKIYVIPLSDQNPLNQQLLQKLWTLKLSDIGTDAHTQTEKNIINNIETQTQGTHKIKTDSLDSVVDSGVVLHVQKRIPPLRSHRTQGSATVPIQVLGSPRGISLSEAQMHHRNNCSHSASTQELILPRYSPLLEGTVLCVSPQELPLPVSFHLQCHPTGGITSKSAKQPRKPSAGRIVNQKHGKENMCSGNGRDFEVLAPSRPKQHKQRHTEAIRPHHGASLGQGQPGSSYSSVAVYNGLSGNSSAKQREKQKTLKRILRGNQSKIAKQSRKGKQLYLRE